MTLNQKEYRARKENTDFLDQGIAVIENSIKDRIRKLAIENNKNKVEAYSKELDSLSLILAGLTGVWTESTIKHLVLDNGVFDGDQAKCILTQNSLTDKWLMAFKCAVTNAYNINTNKPSKIASKQEISKNLSAKKNRQFNGLYDEITRVIDQVRNIRNYVQHGDWVNCYEIDSNTKTYQLDLSRSHELRGKNLLTERLRRHQVKQIYLLIFDLYSFRHVGKFRIKPSSNPAEYFYPKRFGQIKSLEKEISRVDFSKYVNDIMAKERRGIKWEKQNKGIVKRFLQLIKK